VTCPATDDYGNVSECTFHVGVASQGGYCNQLGEDSNCDGLIDAVDLNHLIDVVYFNGQLNGPCCVDGD